MPDNIASDVQIIINDGEIRQANADSTAVTHYMKYFLAKLLTGKSVDEQAKYLAVGYSEGEMPGATPEDIKLEYELTNVPRISTFSTVVLQHEDESEKGYIASLTFIDDSKNKYKVKEMGIFLEKENLMGNCLARTVLENPIEKKAESALSVEWRFKIV